MWSGRADGVGGRERGRGRRLKTDSEWVGNTGSVGPGGLEMGPGFWTTVQLQLSCQSVTCSFFSIHMRFGVTGL